MDALTALGLDDIPPLFFQKFWHIVGPDIITAILSVLKSGKIMRKVNFTYVALIPKQKHPTDMCHLHPISLCNVLYKGISKVLVLTNCLKLILAQLISEHQRAFVPGG